MTLIINQLLIALAMLWAMIRIGLPSAISIGRTASVWYLPELMIADYRFAFLAAAAAAAASDWIDGELARRMGATSAAGAFLDLLGDKTLSIVLMYLGWNLWGLAWWYAAPCVVLIAYHAIVMGLRCIGVVRPRSSRVAKTKFFVEISGLVGCFASFGLGPMFIWADWLGLAAVWLAPLLAFWSMLEYLGIVPDLPEKYYPRRAV